ncbi:hypothetical protein IAT38_006544 [Cryptococcus sp. DSM 104549]
MSASRPKGKKIIPKPRGVAALAASIPQRPRSESSRASGTASPRVVPRGGAPSRGVTPRLDKGKGKAVRPETPISVSSGSPSVRADDDEDDFEEVPIPASAGPSSPFPTTPGTNGTHGTRTAPGSVDPAGNDEEEEDESDEEEEGDGVIHLEIGGETAEEKAKRIALAMRKKPLTAKDRALRLEVHKVHVVGLLASASIRNRWCNDPLLQARLLSLLPHPLQAAFNIPPSRFPDRAQRSRLFFDALQTLVTWWSHTFFDISDSTLGLRTRPWDEVQEVIEKIPKSTRAELTPGTFAYNAKAATKQGKGKDKASKEEEEFLEMLGEGAGGEKLRSVNSLMKKALQQEGSRDVSAQLFVALARSCGLGTRLVTSVQAVPWRAEKVVQKKKTGKPRTLAGRQGMGEDDEDEDEMEEVPIPGVDDESSASGSAKKSNDRGAGKRRHQDPADLYRLRKYRPQPQKLGAPKKRKTKQDLLDQPPVFWAEVFSRSDQRWIPVDPVRGIIRKKTHYEPTSDSGPIRMLYVVAFEEDGYARDVTLRYTKNFYAKTSKMRVPAKPNEPDWWNDQIMGFLQRPYRLNRDDLEDAELETSQISEGMPMHMSGFKDHPIYVLERHLKRDQVLHSTQPIGHFKGEAVFRRAAVLNCKTAENWMRSGRRVREGQEALKWVKQRAVTLQKRRAQELAKQDGEEVTQGLYAEWQTEVYTPPPIVDDAQGKIPQNSFGNIDLYAPTMLPKGAVHLPYKGIAKVAKSLEISYAEACTGFEFKKQRAVPIISGIVVAAENEILVMEAYEESAAMAEEKERIRREERALKRWAKLVTGLRVRLRLQAEYGTGENLNEQSLNPLSEPAVSGSGPSRTEGKTAAEVLAAAHNQSTRAWAERVGEQSGSDGEGVGADAGADDEDEAPRGKGGKGKGRDKVKVEREDSDIEALSPPPSTAPALPPSAPLVPSPAPAPAPSAPRSTRITIRFNNGTPSASHPSSPAPTSTPTVAATTASGRPSRAATRKRKAPSPPSSTEEDEPESTEDEDEDAADNGDEDEDEDEDEEGGEDEIQSIPRPRAPPRARVTRPAPAPAPAPTPALAAPAAPKTRGGRPMRIPKAPSTGSVTAGGAATGARVVGASGAGGSTRSLRSRASKTAE